MKKELVTLGICLLMISVVFSSGCITRWGRETKTDFQYSSYDIYVFSNSSDFQVEISIPFPTSAMTEEELNSSLFRKEEGGVTYYKDDIYGNRINLTVGSRTDWCWGLFNKKIVHTSFSGQDNNHIWIYLNKTDPNEEIYLFLVKEDEWDTKALFWRQIDYVGLMKEPFPAEFPNMRASGEFISIDTSVELMDGWHKYPLTKGTYLEYLD